jgi:hypothetical protein
MTASEVLGPASPRHYGESLGIASDVAAFFAMALARSSSVQNGVGRLACVTGASRIRPVEDGNEPDLLPLDSSKLGPFSRVSFAITSALRRRLVTRRKHTWRRRNGEDEQADPPRPLRGRRSSGAAPPRNLVRPARPRAVGRHQDPWSAKAPSGAPVVILQSGVAVVEASSRTIHRSGSRSHGLRMLLHAPGWGFRGPRGSAYITRRPHPAGMPKNRSGHHVPVNNAEPRRLARQRTTRVSNRRLRG